MKTIVAAVVVCLLCGAGSAHAGNGIMRDGFEPEGWCPPGRITQTVVSWRYDGIGRRSIDVRSAENVWGRAYAGAPTVPFPWLNYFAVFWAMPRHGYIGARFDVPEDVSPGLWGMFTHGETLPGPATDMTISDRCGDFNPPEPYCALYATRTGQRMGVYKLPTAAPVAACSLLAGGAYYINIRFTDPTVEDFFCGAQTCQTTVQHNRNNP